MNNVVYIFVVATALLCTLGHAKAETTAGELELSNQSQSKVAVLLNTEISGNVNGLIASINVKQTFQNNLNDWVNGRYVFPLPEGAAVDSFRIRIGERIIEGLIKEKEQAKREFQAAKKSGKKAGLMSQHRPNVFSISVANIGPNEEIVAELTFVNKVHFENNLFSLRLPTTITPRYIPGVVGTKNITEIQTALEEQIEKVVKEQQHVQANSVSGWASNTALVIDANDITPPQTHSTGSQVSNQFSLALSINAGLNLQRVHSQTHQINSNHLSQANVDVTLANGQEKMDSDLVITWQTVVGETPQTAFFQQKFKDAYYSMLMVTPPQVDTNLSLPRDVTFIVDTSGSMSGTSIRQAKQALHDGLTYLSPNDKFNIIEFNSTFSSLFKESQSVTSSSLNLAHNMVDSLKANGGTEMLAPLKHVLINQKNTTFLNQVVFITDGSIGNEAELFNMIKRELKDARLFMVGIGSAPNTFFMSKAAEFGRGTSTIINNVSQVKDKMADMFKKISSPVMRDIVVTWPQTENVEAYPTTIPDLYNGQPLTVIVKSDAPVTKALIQGHLVNTPWQQSLVLKNENKQQTDNLDTIWARQKVAALMDQLRIGDKNNDKTKADVLKLGLDHSIVTKYTSFIAVEAKPSKPVEQKAKSKAIPNLMPKGSTMPAPQTATPSTLFILLGMILLFLSLVLKNITKFQQFNTGMLLCSRKA